jgi:hypothetical protein
MIPTPIVGGDMNNITQDKEIVKNGDKPEQFDPLMIKYEGHEYEAIKDGVKYKSTDGENWVPETEHQNCKTGAVLTEYEYTKIQNYIEAIRLIAEKMKTAESDCIEQLARDVGNYLYDLVKGK